MIPPNLSVPLADILPVNRPTRIILALYFLSVTIPEFSTQAAEFKGRDIDGESYSATAFSYSTGKYYFNVTVEFSGDEAILEFANGQTLALTLDDEEIDDPDSISAFDYEHAVFWELDVDLDSTSSVRSRRRSIPPSAVPPRVQIRSQCPPGRKPKRDMVPAMCSAMKRTQQLQFTYAGGGLRTVQPHSYGLNRTGEQFLLAYQTSGYSRSGGLPGWRVFNAACIEGLKITEHKFKPFRLKSPRPKQMDTLICATQK